MKTTIQKSLASLGDMERWWKQTITAENSVVRVGRECGLYLAVDNIAGVGRQYRLVPLWQADRWTANDAEEIAAHTENGAGHLGVAVSIAYALRQERANYQAMLDMLPA